MYHIHIDWKGGSTITMCQVIRCDLKAYDVIVSKTHLIIELADNDFSNYEWLIVEHSQYTYATITKV